MNDQKKPTHRSQSWTDSRRSLTRAGATTWRPLAWPSLLQHSECNRSASMRVMKVLGDQVGPSQISLERSRLPKHDEPGSAGASGATVYILVLVNSGPQQSVPSGQLGATAAATPLVAAGHPGGTPSAHGHSHTARQRVLLANGRSTSSTNAGAQQ